MGTKELHWKSSWFEYFSATSAALISLTAGACIGWTNPYLVKLKSEDHHEPLPRPLVTAEVAWVACSMNLAALAATLTSGIMADKIGRKSTLLLYALPMVASDVLLMFSTTVDHLYIARILVGLGVGCIWNIIPLYVAEISQAGNRGFTSLFFPISCAAGQLITYVIGQSVSIAVHAMVSLSYTVSFFVLFGLFAPESPYYYTIAKNIPKAEAALIKLRRTDDVKEEIGLVVKSVEQSKVKKDQDDSWTEIFKAKAVNKALFVALGLFLFQQLTGSSALSVYLQTIFNETRSRIPSHVCLIIVSVAQMITMFISSRFIDMINRRALLFITTVGLGISLIGLATYFHLQINGVDMNAFYWLPVTSVLMYYVLFSIGLGSLSFVIIGEIFPTNHLRTYLNGIATTFCIGMAFAVAMAFPHISDALGMAWPMWIFAMFCGVALIFIYFCLPETSGKTFLEIQLMLQEGRLE